MFLRMIMIHAHRSSGLFPSLIGLILISWSAASQDTRQVDDAALRKAGETGEEWLSYGLTPSETRYSPLKQIDTSNVSRLGLAWSFEVGPGGGAQEATPLMWNGTLYLVTNWSVVVAVDARSGKELWRWDPEVNQITVRPKLCCGAVNRGLALYRGKIIVPVIDGRLVALDANAGKPVWETRVGYPQDNYTITMAPRIAKGKVIIGVAGGEYPIRGHFDAYDANTGELAWRFYTVPGDPSKPFENDAMKKAAKTWDGDWWKLGGGGPVWDGMAYDPDADLFYVGIGNGGPWPEGLRNTSPSENQDSPGKPGKDNLYLCSVVAVKPETGKLKWYFQMVPGDSWDYDSVQPFILTDLTIQGRQRKVIMQANKDGFYYVLDRISGSFISGQPFAHVTWAKGLNEETGRPIVNPEAHYGADAIALSPATTGAHNWSPMSFNPATGLVYIPTTSTSSTVFSIQPNFAPKPGEAIRGIVRGIPGVLPSPPAVGPEPGEGERGILVAWDPVNQKERWRRPGGGGIGGGTVTTAGNLVFQVTPDGRFIAYSADKGEKLWEVQTGLRSGMAPPITYQIDGKQYVSFMGGTGIVVARNTEASTSRGNATPPLLPKLLTFVLDGKALLPTNNAVSRGF
jgi:quinohemoprotein ethanol dehydrogenase